jgi:DNA-3-methyladenine glycosylase II
MRRTASLPVRPPFAFPLALRYLAASPSAVVEQVQDREYVRPVFLRGRWLLLRVREEPGPGPSLHLTLEGQRVRTSDLEAASALVSRLFATAEDVAPFLRAVRPFPPLAALAHRCRGLRPILIGDPFETLIWAVIGQQINLAFAVKLKRALLDRFGGSLVEGGRRYALFPTPERLARLRRAHLAPLQFSRQKADYIIGLSRAVVRGVLDFSALAGLPTEDAVARLTAFHGVGPWTAEYVLLRGLGDRDALPAADGGLRRIVGEEFGLGRLATEEEVRAIAAPLAGWRGYLAFYWWFILQERAHGGQGRRDPRGSPRGDSSPA